MPVMLLTMLGLSSTVALTGCLPTSPQVDVSGIRRVVGTDLIGVRGLTREDQRRVDRTVAGMCGAGAFTRRECAEHAGPVQSPMPEKPASAATYDNRMVPGS